VSGVGYGALVAMFVAGLVTGLMLRGGERRSRPARPLSGPETHEESLARLTPRARPTTGPTQGPVGPAGQAYGGPDPVLVRIEPRIVDRGLRSP
jgi:hypothetical protein